jgi:hypothetical protein
VDIRDVLPRDAIQSVDEPALGPDYFGDPDDEVLVVDADPPRAYPIRMLCAHEIVNDATDAGPIAVTWCPICWSAAVYERRLDGRTLTFGVSGTLVDDALVMYERETGSEWRQTTGECIEGPVEGRTLPLVPSRTTTWVQFRAAHPDGVVLQPLRGGGPGGRGPRAAYDMDAYEAYSDGEGFGLHAMRGRGEPRDWPRTDLDAKTPVLGIERDGEAVGYPLPRVEAAGGLVTDTVGGRDVVVLAAEDRLYTYAHPGGTLGVEDGRLRGGATTWEPTTGRSPEGPDLERVPARTLAAFAWQDAHGPESFYEE